MQLEKLHIWHNGFIFFHGDFTPANGIYHFFPQKKQKCRLEKQWCLECNFLKKNQKKFLVLIEGRVFQGKMNAHIFAVKFQHHQKLGLRYDFWCSFSHPGVVEVERANEWSNEPENMQKHCFTVCSTRFAHFRAVLLNICWISTNDPI